MRIIVVKHRRVDVPVDFSNPFIPGYNPRRRNVEELRGSVCGDSDAFRRNFRPGERGRFEAGCGGGSKRSSVPPASAPPRRLKRVVSTRIVKRGNISKEQFDPGASSGS